MGGNHVKRTGTECDLFPRLKTGTIGTIGVVVEALEFRCDKGNGGNSIPYEERRAQGREREETTFEVWQNRSTANSYLLRKGGKMAGKYT